jgi:hypothetical protein
MTIETLADFYEQSGYSDRLIMLPSDGDCFYSILHGNLPPDIGRTGRAIVRAETGLLEIASDAEVDAYLDSGEWDEVMECVE